MAARRADLSRDGQRVLVGVISGAQGLKGEIRIKSFTADPADLGAYGPLTDEEGGRVYAIRPVGETRGQIVARVEGIADRAAAEALKGVHLYVSRAAFPAPEEDEYYHVDLVGLSARRLADGAEIGTVKAVYDFGAGDMLEIARADGGTVLIPFTRAAVPEVDLAGGRVVVDPPVEVEAREGGPAAETREA